MENQKTMRDWLEDREDSPSLDFYHIGDVVQIHPVPSVWTRAAQFRGARGLGGEEAEVAERCGGFYGLRLLTGLYEGEVVWLPSADFDLLPSKTLAAYARSAR